MQDEIKEGEQLLGTWTLNYIPPTKGRYLGKLYVTNERLLFDAQFDMSMKGILEETLFIIRGSHGFLEIPKSQISAIEQKKSLFNKRVKLTIGTELHQFDYGLLSVDKLAKAIEQ